MKEVAKATMMAVREAEDPAEGIKVMRVVPRETAHIQLEGMGYV